MLQMYKTNGSCKDVTHHFQLLLITFRMKTKLRRFFENDYTFIYLFMSLILNLQDYENYFLFVTHLFHQKNERN